MGHWSGLVQGAGRGGTMIKTSKGYNLHHGLIKPDWTLPSPFIQSGVIWARHQCQVPSRAISKASRPLSIRDASIWKPACSLFFLNKIVHFLHFLWSNVKNKIKSLTLISPCCDPCAFSLIIHFTREKWVWVDNECFIFYTDIHFVVPRPNRMLLLMSCFLWAVPFHILQ